MAVADSHDGKYIVVLGAPGSGKSTNIKWISEAYGIPWINLRQVQQISSLPMHRISACR
jgi:cytidylate kinase